MSAVISRQFLVEGLPRLRGAPALGKSPDFDHPNIAIERHSDHVAGSYHAAWRVNARTVHSHVTRARERGCRATRSPQPGMPQPPVYALAFGLGWRTVLEQDFFGKPVSTFPDHALATAFGIGFELSLQGGKFGER